MYDTTVEKFDDEALIKAKENPEIGFERDPGEHWYDSIKLKSSISKKGKKQQVESFNNLTINHFDAYLNAPVSKVEYDGTKKEKTLKYVDGLIEFGGPSTDVFKGAIVEDKTRELFHKVLFGVE